MTWSAPLESRSEVSGSWRTFSFVGLVVAALFCAASLTPSLLPRHFAVQGLLSGLALAVGYAVGVSLVWLWIYLELPPPSPRVERISKWVSALAVGVTLLLFLRWDTQWQNSIRVLMEMEPVKTAYPRRVALIAGVTGVLLVWLWRGLWACWWFVHRRVIRWVPRRVSYVVSTVALITLVILVANRLIARTALNIADSIFLRIDEVVDDGIEQPTDPLASGSRESAIPWDTIGAQGKRFIARGPTQDQLRDFSGKDAQRPLRVYVGVRTADTVRERARLALEELKRVGGFQRSILVIATPTGTGWLDPGAVDTLEYLHHGDTAIVSIQYSYLPSWITILVDPQRSREAARALFDEVYSYWRTLPRDGRPKLYLHGLSLGSLGSESSADLYTIFDDPIQGAVWSGPPFPSTVWSRITKGRNPESPMWLPRFRDGSMVRFTARQNALKDFGAPWGRMRVVYIQYASDPMIFFSPDLLFREPRWLVGERGPDVSPYLRWYPIVTFLQTAFDLPMATSVPHGYGHNYDPASYLDAWIAVTDPSDWEEDDSSRLRELLAK